MITTLVGKTFLRAYNEKYGKRYSAKEFFEKEYFELFFNHPKYMQWVTNSPFVQMKKNQTPENLTEKERIEKLRILEAKIEKETPDGSFALGFPASENKEYASTSGLVSDMQIETTTDDVYCSWIGSGLGIGVAGGYCLLIDDANICLELYSGWKVYRNFLNAPSLDKLKGNKINSWNGQWLTYKLGNDYDSDFTFATLQDENLFEVNNQGIEITTVNWSNLFFSLSCLYPDKDINSYIYSFGQTNKTIGFIPIQLRSGRRLRDVFRQLFHSEKTFENKEFQSLYGMHIKRACELGNIGLHALRPESLKKYMYNEKNLSFKNDEEFINYQSYKTWIIAMLSKNKSEIIDYTSKLAKLIQKYRAGAKGTERKNLIEKDLLGATSKKTFLDALTVMVNGVETEDLDTLITLRNDVYLMTNEEFGYFNTLLKFDYAIAEKMS